MTTNTRKALVAAARVSKRPLGLLAAQAIRGQALDALLLSGLLQSAGYTVTFTERRNNTGAACTITQAGREVGLGRDETQLDALCQAIAGDLRDEVGPAGWAKLAS